MTIPLFAIPVRQKPVYGPLRIILLAAAGLLVHSLRHPMRPAAICRVTGKVVAR